MVWFKLSNLVPNFVLEGGRCRRKETFSLPPNLMMNKNDQDHDVEAIKKNFDGDYVVVQEKSVPSNGDTVVALVNNNEATLKRYYKEPNRIRLQPANSTMEPIYVEKGTPIKIQGVLIGLIRKY